MKVLLTGASGFVGSHLLDKLLAQYVPTAVLLRSTSGRSFLNPAGGFEVRQGSIEEPQTLAAALDGITHVIHCAGRTRACRAAEYYETNHVGTRNIVEAVNARTAQVQRLLHVSSLAVTGPGTARKPSTELSPENPVSDYGRSKLAGEKEVRENCKTDWVVVRPPAVYGPRDRGFLPLFRAVRSHLLPRTNARQALSLVYVEDLVDAILATFKSPIASRKTYFAAPFEVVTARHMTDIIARKLQSWTLPIPLPSLALWPICAVQELFARVTGRPSLLNLQKFSELRAPGWVCDSSLLAREIGFKCPTNLEAGIERTLAWYKQNGWL